jgi:hypothetical protein
MAYTLPNPPIWQQNRKYSARLDRTFADVLFSEGVLDPGDGQFAVTQNSLGLDNSVDVAAGLAVIEGDDETNQGKYVVRLETAQNIVFGPAPTADARIDLLILRVNDSTAGSLASPVDVSRIEVVQGTVSSSPVAPALPDTAIPLAGVLRTLGDTNITNAMITDLRQVASPLLEVLRIGQKTASYVLGGLDAGQVVEMNVASANTLTVPPDSDVDFLIGTTILVLQTGAGQTTLTPGSGVTINSSNGLLKLFGQWSSATLVKRGADLWVAIGELVP